MYVKSQTVRKPDGRSYTYYRLVESYREAGQVKHRILGQLGSLSREEAAKLARRFAEIAGAPDPTSDGADGVELNGIQQFGPPLLVEHLLDRLGLERCVREAAEKRRVEFDVAAALKVMLCAHLFKSGSRSELAVWDWQQKLFGHGHRSPDLAYAHLLRALGVLVDMQKEVEECLFRRLVDLFSLRVDLVFYDLTSTYVEGRAEWSEILQRGYSRDQRGDCKQGVIGLGVTREGFPVTCRVFDGNTVDKTTLGERIDEVKRRFRIERCLWVSDAGLLSRRNVELLEGSGYEYILGAGNGGRQGVEAALGESPRDGVTVVNGVRVWSVTLAEPIGRCGRLVVLESEGRREKTAAILERRLAAVREGLARVEKRVKEGDLKEREAIRLAAEKALHRSGVTKHFTYEAGRGHFQWAEDAEAVAARKAHAGRYGWLARTDLPTEEGVRAYRTLLAAEDAFRVLKDDLDLRPVWHKCDTNVEGHVLTAMWSCLLYKGVEVDLERHGVDLSVARALQAVKQVQAVEVAIRQRPVWKLMKAPPEAAAVFAAIGLENAKARFQQWAERAPPYHYTPRLYPWKESGP